MNKPLIAFENVVKVYHMGEVEIRAVDGADFTVDKGEFTVIVGPSGAGKTTILNMLGGMDKAIPVDVYVPGCAARPESIIDGVVKGLSVLEEKQKALAVPVREKQALREKELEPEVAINRSQEAGK